MKSSDFLLLGILLLSLGTVIFSSGNLRAVSDEWPSIHHDAGRTGSSLGLAPHSNRIAARIDLPSALTYVAGGLGVASGDTLFFVGRDGSGSVSSVYALDAYSGRVLWIHAYPPVASGTPAGGTALDVADGRLFHSWWISSGGDDLGYVYAYNASNGRVLWTRGPADSLGGDLAVSDGRVFVGSSVSTAALDASTGSTIWTAPYVGALTVADRLVSVGSSGLYPYHFYALDALTGAFVWDYADILQRNGFPDGIYCCFIHPSAGGDQIFLLYDKGGSQPGIMAVNTTSGLPSWSSTVGGMGGMVLHEDSLFTTGETFSSPNSLYALDRMTGTTIWRVDVPGQYWGVDAYADGLLFASNGYAIYALNASNGETVWSYVGLENANLAGEDSVIVTGGRLYTVSRPELLIFEDLAGEPDFTVELWDFVSWFPGRPPDWDRPLSIDVGVNSQNSFQGKVTLSLQGLPSPANASWSSNPVSLTPDFGVTTSLRISLTRQLYESNRVYTINVTATNGTITHTYSFQLGLGAYVRPRSIWALPFLIPLVALASRMGKLRASVHKPS